MIEPRFPGVLLTEAGLSAKPIDGVATSNPDEVGMTPLERLAGTSIVQPPAWTQANESDPGVTQVELTAWLGESVAYRAQQDFGHSMQHASSAMERTLKSDSELKYENLRRYAAYVEQSISRGVQFAAFEPNGEALWQNVRTTVSDFLYNEWQRGALQGTRPEEAFFVKCDRTTMTQDDIDNGRLVVLVGIATTKPAEFVILRISAMTAGASA